MKEISLAHWRSGSAVPVIFVHGTAANGAEMRAYVETHTGGVTFPNSLFCYPTFKTPYQFLLPQADTELITFLAHLWEAGRCNGRMVLVGFSGGAQFAHRFALKHPNLVAGAICLSAGCWTNPRGESYGMMVAEDWFAAAPWNTAMIQAALKARASTGYKNVHWVIGCGNADKESRKQSAHRFFREIKTDRSQFFSYSGAHDLPTGEDAQAFFTIIHTQVVQRPGNRRKQGSVQ